MTTARELITDSLSDCGVLDVMDTMSADQAAHGLRTLNRIIDRWRGQRLFVYAIAEVVATFTGASAQVGTGLTVNTDHPQRLEDGCFFVKSGMSYPLPVWSRERYNAVIIKNQAGDYPQGVYYDRNLPGTVYVWPVPSVPTEYHFQVMQKLSAFADLDTDYSFPDGYRDALFYTLNERIPKAYNLQVDPTDVREAMNARRAIKRANTLVPLLDLEVRAGRINILTNQVQ